MLIASNILKSHHITFKKITFTKMNYSVPELLTLPDNFLLEEIFADLSLQQLSQLCATYNRFNKICSNDRLWQIKTFEEYPTKANQRPINIS